MKIKFTFVILLAVLNSIKSKKKKDPYEFSSKGVDYYDSAYFGSSEKSDAHYDLFSSIDIKLTQFKFDGYLRQRFAFEAARDNPRKSMICSPISALMPLGKLVLGATGRSRVELLEALGAKSDKTVKVEKELKKTIKSLRKLKGVTVTIASQIFVADKVPINTDFTKKTLSVFKTGVETADFSKQHEAARKINTWISSKTSGMIQNIVGPNDLSSDVSIVLVNAVYFKGKWKYRFKNSGTGSFYSPSGNIQVPMMKVTESYNYLNSDALDSQLIEIPYEKGKVSFIVILPNKRDGLPHLLNTLTLVPDSLNAALKRVRKYNVAISLPKFKVESSLDLGDFYKKSGVQKIFARKDSGLTKILHTDDVYVSKAVQKAVIEVSEVGTEASAGSAVIMEKLSAKVFKNQVAFVADHPFMFFINGKDEQLFVGTFNSL